MTEPFHPTETTAVEAWDSPRKQGILVMLPSGNVCRVKRTLDMRALLQAGKIPNPLAASIQSMLDKGEPALQIGGMDVDAQGQLIAFMDTLVVSAMVEPKVVIPPETDDDGNVVAAEMWEPPPGTISIMDLSIQDKIFIVGVAQGGTTDLEYFRLQQKIIMERMANGPRLPDPAKPPARPQRARSSSKRK